MIKYKRLNKELFHNIQTEVLDSSFDKIGEAWLIR